MLTHPCLSVQDANKKLRFESNVPVCNKKHGENDKSIPFYTYTTPAPRMLLQACICKANLKSESPREDSILTWKCPYRPQTLRTSKTRKWLKSDFQGPCQSDSKLLEKWHFDCCQCCVDLNTLAGTPTISYPQSHVWATVKIATSFFSCSPSTQLIPRHHQPSKESISNRFSVNFESFLSDFQIDSKTTEERLEIDSGESVVVGDESGGWAVAEKCHYVRHVPTTPDPTSSSKVPWYTWEVWEFRQRGLFWLIVIWCSIAEKSCILGPEISSQKSQHTPSKHKCCEIWAQFLARGGRLLRSFWATCLIISTRGKGVFDTQQPKMLQKGFRPRRGPQLWKTLSKKAENRSGGCDASERGSSWIWPNCGGDPCQGHFGPLALLQHCVERLGKSGSWPALQPKGLAQFWCTPLICISLLAW